MGLNHGFVLADYKTDNEYSLGKFNHNPHAVYLHDDFISYVWDTLLWIPTMNPSTNQSSYGLNRWGHTLIECEGAQIASRVFMAWSQLLAIGPSELELTGLFVLPPKEEIRMPNDPYGYYDKINYDRDNLLTVINQLVIWCNLVSNSTGEMYLHHGGI